MTTLLSAGGESTTSLIGNAVHMSLAWLASFVLAVVARNAELADPIRYTFAGFCLLVGVGVVSPLIIAGVQAARDAKLQR